MANFNTKFMRLGFKIEIEIIDFEKITGNIQQQLGFK